VRAQAQVNDIHRDRLCVEAQLAEPTTLRRTADFFILVASWVNHLADPENHGYSHHDCFPSPI
jgi:hypothetical protein